MLNKLRRRVNRWRFKRSIRRLRRSEFCLISNNCLGRRLYQILGRDYNTPFVGLFMMPGCFTELVVNFEEYMSREIQFVDESKYPSHNQQRSTGKRYPIGLIGHAEIHFLHYESESEALEKWNRRKSRIDYQHLYYVMVANGPYDEAMLAKFVGADARNKVCFHREGSRSLPAGAYVPSEDPNMGNLYSQYQRFVGYFDFADWMLGK
ncbi:MAG: DUF1919 domain-containing protein [Opitutae bacterium]|nr:DUF1919 domain-containing protein [Opitutae bacterium]